MTNRKRTMEIDTGDHVRHGPTGEDWVVRYVRGDRLAWCGWPPGEANLSDCALIRKATPEERVAAQVEVARQRGAFGERTMSDRDAVLHAAKLLEREAEALWRCHTLRGEWTDDDTNARRDHSDMIATAQRLRMIAKRMH